MPLKINGASTGSVTLSAPATGSDVTLNLPGSSGTLPLQVGYQFVETVYYTSSGTFVKANYPWLRAIRIKVQGAGGGGGGCANSGSSQSSAGSGGGGGAYGEKFLTDISGLSASVTVTIGAGGSAGVGSTATGGGNGGQSSFGIYSASGGGGGQHGPGFTSPGTEPFGGFGGETTANMDLSIPGENGLGGIISSVTRATFQGASLAGNGGNSYLGKGGRPGNAAAGGVNAGIQGGGGGARNLGADGAGSGNGAAGGAGLVILELYA